jgi:hypothetical protein
MSIPSIPNLYSLDASLLLRLSQCEIVDLSVQLGWVNVVPAVNDKDWFRRSVVFQSMLVFW